MKKDDAAPLGLQSLSDARPSLRDNVGDWLKSRLRASRQDDASWRADDVAVLETPVDVVQAEPAPAAPPALVEDDPAVQACKVVVLGAPHPVSRMLFQDIAAIVADREADERAIELSFLTTSDEAWTAPADVSIYLRSDCAGGSRIAAALEAPGDARLVRAARVTTYLDDWYWHRPNLSVEAALLDEGYMAARVQELFGVTLGPAALQREKEAFKLRAETAGVYCDLLGYMAAVELEPMQAEVEPVVSADGLLARTLQACHGADPLIVAGTMDAVPADFATADVRTMEAALEVSADEGPTLRAACLIDMADEPRAPELVKKLEAERWVLCGVERSLEAVWRFCSRCLEAGVGHNMSFVFEGAEWKAHPRATFEP